MQNTKFANVLVGMVNTSVQVRGEFIDQSSEAFVALRGSSASQGVLQPIRAIRYGGEYRLLDGERGLLACRALSMGTIPARQRG